MYKAAPGGAILGLALSVLAVAAPTPTSQPAPLASHVEQLLKRLDSDSYAEREAAAEEADQLPPEALPLLETALRKSGLSPEVRSSLVGVVKKLRQLANTQSQYQATVDWFRAQYAQQYDEVGQKNPAWDAAAHHLLEEAAKVLAAQLLNRHADDAVYEAAAAVRKTQCSDPLVRYLSLRFDRSPQLKPLKDLWPAMKASAYSAHRKASHAAYVVSAAADARRPPVGDRLMVRPYLVAAAELWPTVLEDPSFPAGLAIRQLQSLLDDARQAGIDRKDAWAILDAQLARTVPEDHLVRLNIRGYHLVRLGNELRNNARTDIESDAATQVVEQAEKILTRCYELYPDDTNAPSTMLWLDSVQSRGLEFFNTWFDRAIKADPHNYGAYYKKLTYLDPASYGTDEQYLVFARQCLASGQFDTRIPLLVVDAHRELQEGEEWASLAPKPYYAQPEVWGDIYTAYEGFLRHNPSATGDRYDYAELAYNAGQFATAAEQYRILAQTPSWSKRNTGLVRLIQLELTVRLKEPQPRPNYAAKAMARDAVDAADTRRATVDAYEVVGHRNEKWDFAARAALEAAARALSGDPKQTFGENDIILQMGKSALDAGCDDPLVRWIYSDVADERVTPEKPQFTSVGFPAALALLDSEYPAFIKLEAFTRSAYTRMHVEKSFDDDARAEFRAAIDKAAALVGPALAENQGRPAYIADLAGRILWRVNGVGGDVTATYHRLRDDLAKAGLDAASLDQLQGVYLYEYAYAAHPDKRNRENGDDRELAEFRRRMAAAETFCLDAWQRWPDRRNLGLLMMRIGRHTHSDRAQLMFWFRQAQLADPYRRGTVDALIASTNAWRDVEPIVRLAATTHYWHTQLPFVLVTYHVDRARQLENGVLQDLPDVERISDEDVWADIAEVFESYLAKYPQDSDRRSEYASLACRAGRWPVAIQQFEVLGDRIRPKPFGTQARFEACRDKIASFNPTTQPSQPTE